MTTVVVLLGQISMGIFHLFDIRLGVGSDRCLILHWCILWVEGLIILPTADNELCTDITCRLPGLPLSIQKGMDLVLAITPLVIASTPLVADGQVMKRTPAQTPQL
jgi:hypothetical protein